MYGGVVVQELLPRRRGPWRWGRQRLALKVRKAAAGHRKLTTTESIIETNPLETAQETAQELNVKHSMVTRHLKQIGKVKKLYDMWVPHELIENFLKCRFKVLSSLILCNYNETFLHWIVTCDKKWILYDNWQQPAQWLDQEEAPKHFPKPNLHQKRSWSPFSGLLLVWSTTAFWILMKPLHLRSMLSKLITAMPIASTGQQKGPILLHDGANCILHNQCIKSWINWDMKFCLIHHIHLTPTDYHFFKYLDNFLQGKGFHNQQNTENAFQEFIESWSTGVYVTGISKHFSVAKMFWL